MGALRQSESDKNEILKNENAAKQQTIESLENKLNLINGRYQEIALKLKGKTENNEKLTVKYNDIIEEQKDLKVKYEALKNENDEIIKQHQNKMDITKKEYDELKQRNVEILEISKKEKISLVELKGNLDALRIKNEEYQQKIE